MTTLLDRLQQSADDTVAQMSDIETRAAERDDLALTDAETQNLSELRSELASLEKRIEVAQQTAASTARVAAMRSATTSEQPTEQRNLRLPAQPKRGAEPGGRVGGEPPVYNEANAGLFIRDLVASQVPQMTHRMTKAAGDENYQERLNTYQRMTSARARQSDIMTRNVETSNLAGLIVPQYRRDLIAKGLHNGKVVAALARDMGFPTEGVQIVIPRTNNTTALGVQTDEDVVISETSPTTASLTLNMTTIGAFADVSVQAIEQGSMSEMFLLEDLGMAAGASIENQVINGTGSNGQVTGILSVSGNTDQTWTEASPTFANAWLNLAGLVSGVATARKRRPDCLVFSQQTWAWITAQTDSTRRPLYTTLAQGPFANIGVGDVAPMDSRMPMPVGQIMGINAYVSDAVPTNVGAGTNESRVLAFSRDDLLISESSQMPTVVAELNTDEATLNIRFTAYSFLFFTAARYPTGIGTLLGTGMAAAL